MAADKGLILSNPESVKLHDIPEYRLPDFSTNLESALASGNRMVAYFGHKEQGERLTLYVVLADDPGHTLEIFKTSTEKSFQSLSPVFSQAHLFEREISEQFGIPAIGHPWAKSVRFHSAIPDGPEHPFFTIEGGQTHEVAVGPVHAGVIEPGHFRFQCEGELVHHLEIQLGYQHRGVESLLNGGPYPRSIIQMETAAGDTSIGHATAYCQNVEALASTTPSAKSLAIRAIALELERLANHVGDIGAISNDIGFLPTSAYCGRLRGDLLNTSALVCGSRLGRGTIRQGGVAFDIEDGLAAEISNRLRRTEQSLKNVLDVFFDNQSVLARLQGTGVLTARQCIDLGLVGPPARSCGVKRDVRTDHPFGWYKTHSTPVKSWDSGDVYARAIVRRMEIEESLRLINNLITNLPAGGLMSPSGSLQGERLALSMVEGWRGEIAHIAITDKAGKFARYKIVDPSFHNWFGLAMAMRGQQISDFPLCNKSFNLSYCGFDL